jgi:hypothetical protein
MQPVIFNKFPTFFPKSKFLSSGFKSYFPFLTFHLFYLLNPLKEFYFVILINRIFIVIKGNHFILLKLKKKIIKNLKTGKIK